MFFNKKNNMYHFQAQIVLLIILLVAILDFLIGAFIGPLDSDEFTRGYVGFNGTYFSIFS